MDFSLPAASPDLSLDIARFMPLFRDGEPHAVLRAAVSAARPGLVNTGYSAPSPMQPAYASFAWADASLVLVDGTSIPAQAGEMIDQLSIRNVNHTDHRANAYYTNVASDALALALQNSGRANHRWVVAGHSLGGPIAELLAYHLMRVSGHGEISCITYGSPKPGEAQFARAIQTLDLVRWMCVGDPVPQVPTQNHQTPVWFAGLALLGRWNSNRYVQPHGGLLLAVDGTVVKAVTEDISEIDLVGSLGSWLIRLATMQVNAHSMPIYIARLTQRLVLLGNTRPLEMGDSHIGLANHDSHYTIAQQVKATQDRLNGLVREGGATQVGIPEGQAFTARRNGSVWSVYLRAEFIATGPTRRRARHLASVGNIFLRHLQPIGIVDTAALVSALQLYLVDAADPESAFKPTMRTSII